MDKFIALKFIAIKIAHLWLKSSLELEELAHHVAHPAQGPHAQPFNYLYLKKLTSVNNRQAMVNKLKMVFETTAEGTIWQKSLDFFD